MNRTYLIIAIVVAIICIYLYCCANCRESFDTVSAKAGAYKSWMTQNPRASYEEFREANPEANIVEYNKLRKIYMQPVTRIAEALRI